MTNDGEPQSRFDRTDLVWPSAVAVVGLGVVSLVPYLHSLHYVFELFVHFRHVYAVSALVLALLLVAVGDRRWFVGALAAVVLNGAYVVPWYVSEGADACSADGVVRVAVANVRASNRHHGDVRRFVEDNDPDVLVVVEYSHQLDTELSSTWADYDHRKTHPRTDNFGIAVFSNIPLRDVGMRQIGPAGTHQIRATLRTEKGPVRLWAVHPLPPVGADRARARDSLLRRLANRASSSNVPFVLAGDLNTTMWAPSYGPLRDSGLTNAREGFGLLGTWPAWFPLGIPIDHVLHSREFRTCHAFVGPNVGSDHRPLVVDLRRRSD